MGHQLQFGSGPHKLPAPWQNLDVEHDIRKPLRFADESTRYIVNEHVIEHVDFHQGLFFLRECFRILEPGGVLRVSFPDVVRVSHHPTKWAEAFRETNKGARTLDPREVTLLLFTGWGHKMAWTEALMYATLMALGFRRVVPVEYFKSEYPALEKIDGHHHSVGTEMALAETSVVEATK